MLIRKVTPTVKSGGFTYATLNPADKDPDVTLSNGNLSFSCANPGSVRANMSKSSGKWQYELTITSLTSTSSGAGISDGAGLLTSYPGSTATSWGLLVLGDIRRNGASVQVATAFAVGDIITVAFDVTGNTITWYKNGVMDGSPATLSSATTTPFPMVGGNMAGTVNFGATPLSYPVAGYNLGVYI